jgi:copper(I)-binding protein
MRSLLLTFCSFAFSAAALAQPVVSQAWVRPTVQGQTGGGGYLRIDNPGGAADRLLGASSDVAASTELHSMSMDGDVMRMRKVDGIDVPAGGKVELKPGGLHLMFIGLKAPLQAGTKVPLTLRFEKAGEVKAQAQVAARAPADGGHEHHHHK